MRASAAAAALARGSVGHGTLRALRGRDGIHVGLVNKVVPAADLMTAARQLAADVCWAAPLSVTAILDIERRTAQMDPIEAMGIIQDLPSYRAAIDSEDAQEGTVAYGERRAPVWKGR